MNKNEFLKQLQKALSSLPQEDIKERLNFYSEMIDDYIEEGLSEEEAIGNIGTVNEVAAQILDEFTAPKANIAKKRKRMSTAAIILIILGSPIWLSLLISAFAIVLSLLVSFWSLIISIWSVFAALAGSSFGCILGGTAMFFAGFGIQGAAMIGAGLVSGGLSVFTFFACKAATKSAAFLTKKLVLVFRNKRRKKEDA